MYVRCEEKKRTQANGRSACMHARWEGSAARLHMYAGGIELWRRAVGRARPPALPTRACLSSLSVPAAPGLAEAPSASSQALRGLLARGSREDEPCHLDFAVWETWSGNGAVR